MYVVLIELRNFPDANLLGCSVLFSSPQSRRQL